MTPDPDPLRRTGDDPPAPTPAARRRIICESCECELSANGDVLKHSEKAKKFRDLALDLERKDQELGAVNTSVRELKREIEALKSAGTITRPQAAKLLDTLDEITF